MGSLIGGNSNVDLGDILEGIAGLIGARNTVQLDDLINNSTVNDGSIDLSQINAALPSASAFSTVSSTFSAQYRTVQFSTKIIRTWAKQSHLNDHSTIMLYSMMVVLYPSPINSCIAFSTVNTLNILS